MSKSNRPRSPPPSRQSTNSQTIPSEARYGSISRSLSAPWGTPLYVISARCFFMRNEGCYGRSYSLQVGHGALVLHVAGVERARRLKQDDVRLFQRIRHV